MKKNILLLIAFSTIITSCKVTSLIEANNKINEDISSKLDSLDLKITEVTSESLEYNKNPSLTELKRTTFDEFYSGNVTKEEIIELKFNWKKIQLEKNIQSGNQTITKTLIGYFNLNTPQYIYLVNSDDPIEIDKNRNRKFTTITTEIDSINKIITTTERTDNYTQKELDFLIANGDYCFDGFMFDNKRFDYLDFEKGSFRGTIFDNCFLDNAIVSRTGFNNTEYDFTKTQIKNSTQNNLFFSYWKFDENTFFKVTFNQSTFENCKFDETSFNQSNFTNVTFKNNLDGYLNNFNSLLSSFQGCTFDATKIYSGVMWGNTFTSSTFKNCEIKWTGLINYGSTPTKIEVCNFNGGKFHAGNQSNIIIEHPAGYTEFVGVEFSSINWRNARIKAWFRDNCTFSYGSNLENINWLNSIFENISFNSNNPPTSVNMKNSDFSSVDFRSNVVFYNCDFDGSTFPSISELQNAGVKFFNCTYAPYDN